MMNCCKKSGIVFLAILLQTFVLNAQFVSMGSWDENGRPYYLEDEGISCSLEFWERLNEALPERVSLALDQNEVLESGGHDLYLIDSSSVTITFIHEGAGWKNSLFYYTYTQEPSGPEELDLNLVFPNSSLYGSGGALAHGDQVSIGSFPAGTYVGFGLVARGWQRRTASVENNLYSVFSNPSWNPEPNPELKQHSVLLSDPEREMVLIGFEDIRRDWQSCDHDFNDCIFGINVDPFDPESFQDLPQLSESNSPCYSVPVGLGADEIKLYKTTVSWEEIEGAEAYRVRYRKWNSNDDWEYRNAGSNTSIVLGAIDPLSASTHYEWQVAVTCNGVQTGNSVKHVFTTLSPCHMSLGGAANPLDESSVRLTWTPSIGAENYQIRFRELGEEAHEWRNAGSDSYIDLFNLEPGSSYQWNVQTQCSPLQSCFAPYLGHFDFTMPLNFWAGELRSTVDCSDRRQVWDIDLIQSWNQNLQDAQIYQNNPQFLVFNQNGLFCLTDGELYEFPNAQNVISGVAFAMGDQWKIAVVDQFGFRVRVLDAFGTTEQEYIGDEQWVNVVWFDNSLVLKEMNHHKMYRWNFGNPPAELQGTDGLEGEFLMGVEVSGDGQTDLVSMNDEEIHFVINRTEHDTMPWVTAAYQLNGSFSQNEFAHRLPQNKWVLPLSNGTIQVLETAENQLLFNTFDLQSDLDLFNPKFTYDEELGVALFCAWNSESELCYGWWDFVNDVIEIEGNIGEVDGQRIEWFRFENQWMISVLSLENGMSWYEVSVSWGEVAAEVWVDKNEGLLNVKPNIEHVWYSDTDKSIRLLDANSTNSIAKGNENMARLTLSNEQCANFWKMEIEKELLEELEESLLIFPNPVQNEVQLQVSTKFEGACKFELFSTSGRSVMKGLTKSVGSLITLDVSLLSSGSYILRLMNDKAMAVANFVKVQ